MTSIFGELEIDEIPDDPFHIEPDIYHWLVTKAHYQTARNDSNKISAVIVFNVDDQESEFHGKPCQQWYRIYPHMTKGIYTELPPDEKAEVNRNNSNLKATLRALGVSEAEMSQINEENFNETVMGRRCIATLVTNQDKNDPNKIFKNLIRFSPVEDEEETPADPFSL